ncbi:MAG: RNA polymerase sigma factor [Deltaproteobacteria bacterium]|nr:RNA polymerase sigma factor [Deltaproteobacteria bacterium]
MSEAHAIVEPVAVPTFDDVYAAHVDAVYRYASNRVPAASVDDVVQETFLVVHRRLASFAGRSSVRTWVIGIVRNVARDHLRALARRPSTALDEDQQAGTDPSPADLIDRKHAVAVLDEALARMTDDQKEAFLLVEVEQLTSREAAEVLETNDNTVRTRLRAARALFAAAVTRFRARQRWGADHG